MRNPLPRYQRRRNERIATVCVALILAWITFLLCSCSLLARPEYGQGADIATTALGLSQGLSEANPLASTPAGLAAVVGAKLAAPSWALRLEPEPCIRVRTLLSDLGWGAAAWNVSVLLGAPLAAPVVLATTAAATDGPAREQAAMDCWAGWEGIDRVRAVVEYKPGLYGLRDGVRVAPDGRFLWRASAWD